MSNRNMLSTYLCMAFCVSAVMFSRYKPSNENLFGKFPDKLAPGVYLITGWIIFYMMILGQTESGYVALLVSFVLLFPFVATCRRSAARLIFMFSGCLFWIWASAGIHHNLKDWEHLPNIWRPFGPGLIFLAVLLAVLALGLAFIPKLPKINRWVFRSAWYALIVAAAIAIVIAIPQLAAISGHKTIHAASEILQGNFDDTLGGHRIFIWRRAITLVPERPLFGHGPDNFAIVFMERFVEDAEGITYDKAHNEYIQQLVDNGILGLSALLAFYGLSLWKLRKKLQNPVSLALLLAMTAFMVQAFFNFSTPFAHPMVWALWGMVCAAGIRGGENPENTG
jgi:O-antigen ligase